jgi:hypothetical protein
MALVIERRGRETLAGVPEASDRILGPKAVEFSRL